MSFDAHTELQNANQNTWDESVEHILSELGDEAQINAFLHKKSNENRNKAKGGSTSGLSLPYEGDQ